VMPVSWWIISAMVRGRTTHPGLSVSHRRVSGLSLSQWFLMFISMDDA
jgi:hypothetical protein